jgi:hypothetical protein
MRYKRADRRRSCPQNLTHDHNYLHGRDLRHDRKRRPPTLPASCPIVYGGDMDLLNGLLTGGFVGALPLVVLLLVCAGCYLVQKRGRTDLTDSPWFWALAFSGMGLLGVWAISGKYDDRQKRVEVRYEARERITAIKDGATAADSELAAPQAGYSSERRVPLHFLAGGLLIVSVVSLVMLSRRGRNVADNDRPELVDPQRR